MSTSPGKRWGNSRWCTRCRTGWDRLHAPPPEVPVLEFGLASWVKEIRTTSHNNNEVKLRDLVSDDPDDPEDRNWRNGEPDEVEVEWQILQTDYNAANGGANGEEERLAYYERAQEVLSC